MKFSSIPDFYEGISQPTAHHCAGGHSLCSPTARQALRQAVLAAASEGLVVSHVRTRGGDAPAPAGALQVPHEHAALDSRTAAWVARYAPVVRASCCGSAFDYGILVGRAQQLESGRCCMFGASAFFNHPVSCSIIVMDEELDAEKEAMRLPSRGALVIKLCYRCHFWCSLVGSAMRSDVYALSVWQAGIPAPRTHAAWRTT